MRNYIYVVMILLSCGYVSCSKVLDKKPLDTITDAVLWSDPVLMDDYLNQCYAEMRFYFEMPYGKDMNSLMTNNSTDALTIADEAFPSWAETATSPRPDWVNINGGNFEWWGYPTVRKLNIFIEKLQNPGLTEEYRKQRLGEARFLRAFAYFNMVKRYGGVPLITKELKLDDADEELYPNRNKEEEVYDFILSELDAISADLPGQVNAADLGRPGKYAALALKSRAAMYAASIASWGTIELNGIVGIPQGKAASYWQASYDASAAIINSGKYTLYNKIPGDKAANFRNIFLDEGNAEVIFSERFDGLAGKGHSLDMLTVPWSYHVWGGGQKISPYLEMVESFDNVDGTPGTIDRDKIDAGYLWTVDELWGKKDPRFKASIYTHGTKWTGQGGPEILDYHYAILVNGDKQTTGSYKGVLARSRSIGEPRTNFGMLKYLDEEERALVQERKYSDVDYIIFRLGEIYLNLAEAALELGKAEEALDAVNSIRDRAGMPKYTAINSTLIRKERKVELAFEGNRYFDVRRWRAAVSDLTREYHNLTFILDGNSFTENNYNVLTAKYKIEIVGNVGGNVPAYFQEKHYYMPISNPRTGINSNLVENPGYF